MGLVRIGTSGYSYTDWIGSFYPDGTPGSGFLSFYAERFRTVELNFSYYTQPKAEALERMAAAVPDGFLFSIKGHGSLTHLVSDGWKTDAATFKEGVAALRASGKLSTVILQFPYSFHHTKKNRTYLASLCDELSPLPLSVEFRNNEWQSPRVYRGMEDRGLGFVCTDSPPLPGLPAPLPIVTSDVGYVRFHGRNSENWWEGTSATRYDYLYSNEELGEWVDRIAEIASKTRILIVAFNNHIKGQAVQNAGMLRALLKDAGGLDVA